MASAKPSLELVRSLTDELVLRALMRTRRLTRAEIASLTGISKPTASESVRRLVQAGLLSDTGERTTGRGRVGTYYGLAASLGTALVVSIAPEGVEAESIDVHGDVVGRAERAVARPARPAEVARGLSGAAREALGADGRTARLAVVSAADPVDRTTGRLVHLPDAPFLLGELEPVEVLSPLVDGPMLVDNDVNWAARAERDAAGSRQDFAYVHLGEGLGCAIVADGEVRRGHGGLAGEIAHLVTTGPSGQAQPFTQVFADLGLRRAGSSAIDVQRLLAAVTGSAPGTQHVRDALSTAITGVLTAVVALADPSTIVMDGPWGSHPVVLDAVTRQLGSSPRRTEVRPGTVGAAPALTGARTRALEDLRRAVITRATGTPATG